MAEDKLLSMSLDDIIKLKRASGRTSSSQSSSRTGTRIGTRGRASFASYRRRGRIGFASNRILRRGGVKSEISYGNNRGTYLQRGYSPRQRGSGLRQRNLPLRIEDRILQRKRNMDLARNRLQMAKRFLNSRQRRGVVPRRNMSAVDHLQYRRMPLRGVTRGVKRGRGGLQSSTQLLLNTFRSNQISQLYAYRNKLNRSLNAMQNLNQIPAAQSLVVSIENERAGSAAASGMRGGRRGMRRRGNLSRVNLPTIQLSNNMYQQRTPLPFHSGALNPEIQRMIADIQGKTSPMSGMIGNRSLEGILSIGGGARGFGVGRGQRVLGRGQFASRQRSSQVADGLNVGLPMTTSCTLNERFGGRM